MTKEIKLRSYGIIPVAMLESGEVEFLLLRAYKNWDFPKGGSDENESPVETARREMTEETGIVDVEMPWGELSKSTVVYGAGKVATYYLGRIGKRSITLPVSEELGRPEHDEYRWVSYQEAKTLLPERLVDILDWASSVIGVR